MRNKFRAGLEGLPEHMDDSHSRTVAEQGHGFAAGMFACGPVDTNQKGRCTVAGTARKLVSGPDSTASAEFGAAVHRSLQLHSQEVIRDGGGVLSSRGI